MVQYGIVRHGRGHRQVMGLCIGAVWGYQIDLLSQLSLEVKPGQELKNDEDALQLTKGLRPTSTLIDCG